MVAWAEEHLAARLPDGQHELNLSVYDYDVPRRRLLAARGYTETDDTGVARRMRFGARPLSIAALPEGYAMREIPGDEADCWRLADLLNAAFRRTCHHGGELATFAAAAPSFRRDLHLVAVCPDGTFAAHVGVTYDEANRHGVFEPVCTHPAHLRRGLARALMFELLHRLKALGAADVTVETGSAVAANAFYDSVGFTEAYLAHTWVKRWSPRSRAGEPGV